MARFSNLDIRVHAMTGDELYTAITQNELDIAVSNSKFRSAVLSKKLLRKSPLTALIRSDDPLSSKETVTIKDLDGKQIYVVKHNGTFLEDLKQAVDAEGIHCKIYLLNSMDAISIFRELSDTRNFVHLTADFFSDMILPKNQYCIKKLQTSDPMLNKDIYAYYKTSEAGDAVLQEYVKYLRCLVE